MLNKTAKAIKSAPSFYARQLIRPGVEVYKAGASLAQTIGEAANSIRSLRETTKNKDIDLDDPTIDPKVKAAHQITLAAREISSDRERFEFVAAKNKVSERDLASRLKQLQRNQAIFLILTTAFGATGLWSAFSTTGNLPFAVMLLAMTSIGTSLFLAWTMKAGLFRTQITRRELISWNKFAALPDFWKRAFWPF